MKSANPGISGAHVEPWDGLVKSKFADTTFVSWQLHQSFGKYLFFSGLFSADHAK
jgi:hypothetical protein